MTDYPQKGVYNVAKRCLDDTDYWKRKLCTDECPYYDTCIYRTNKEKAKQKQAELKEQEQILKSSNRHDIGELQIYQSYSLERKIQLTRQRIEAWYEWWDGNVYISFSGGKDSTVLLDLVRNVCGYKDVPAVFVDTGLEYPEIRDFVKTFDNVIWLKPKKNFKQVITEYGYPFISKKVSNAVGSSRKWLERKNKNENKPPLRLRQLKGVEKNKDGKLSTFNKQKYEFMLDSPYRFSDSCCGVMKKAPAHEYSHKTGRFPMTGEQAAEGRQRTQNWIDNGCNGFYLKEPKSTPMAFWTEQDILLYIKTKGLKICSVYGDIVEDTVDGQVEGQMTFSDLADPMGMELFDADRPPLKTTGCSRTGCMFCGFGCHLEKEGEGRFERMKHTHPKLYEYIMKPTSDGGLNYKEVIDWINENGNLNIRY